MAGLSGDESPMPPNRQRNGEHGEGLVNGDAGGVAGGQLSTELRNLVSILGRQSDNGISLEQLLSGASPTRNMATPTSSVSHPIPTTPSSSRSSSWAGRKRGRPFDSDDASKRRRVSNSYPAKPGTGEKGHQGKGLRHFSQRVCEKVRQKGNTTYNEVADELVKELSESERKSHGSNDMPIDHKNIRRRVYDALNVLMAMNIISKEKKDIRWIGLPTNSVQECQHIEEEVLQAEQRIQGKRSKVEELIVQILSYKNLMKRNRERVSSLGAPAQNSAIGLPFIIVNTSKNTTIDCSISSDKSEYVFSFDNAFELHNDIDILRKMGLDCGIHSGSCSAENLKLAKSMLPKAFGDTLDEIVSSKSLQSSEDPPLTPVATSQQQPPASFCSTPSPNHLTPFTTPNAASSPHMAALAAVLAQAAAANINGTPAGGGAMLQQQQHASSPLSVPPDLTPGSQQQFSSPLHTNSTLLANNVAGSSSFSTPPGPMAGSAFQPSAMSSPSSSFFSDTTPTNNNCGSTPTTDSAKMVVPIAAKTLLSSSPMMTGSKSILHHQPTPHSNIPQPNNGSSPLVKSSMPGGMSSATLTSSRTNFSTLLPSGVETSKSPAANAKFVTASKVSNEQFNTLLQQLNQNPSISRLLSAATLQANGNGTS